MTKTVVERIINIIYNYFNNSFCHSKAIKNYNRTTRYYIQAWARRFGQVRSKRFFIST